MLLGFRVSVGAGRTPARKERWKAPTADRGPPFTGKLHLLLSTCPSMPSSRPTIRAAPVATRVGRATADKRLGRALGRRPVGSRSPHAAGFRCAAAAARPTSLAKAGRGKALRHCFAIAGQLTGFEASASTASAGRV